MFGSHSVSRHQGRNQNQDKGIQTAHSYGGSEYLYPCPMRQKPDQTRNRQECTANKSCAYKNDRFNDKNQGKLGPHAPNDEDFNFRSPFPDPNERRSYRKEQSN
jgi:hypothetical protein